ncbi:MAG: 30S ribosome-binding factor RbfA [Phycisphaeraceae bacterium]|nr:30S ribosome-binding factor RbfA [Phycisphaeraceae bacterium]
MSHRIPQVESALMRAVSQVISRGLADPRVSGLVSITKVQVSPDLSEAYIQVSVVPSERQDLTVAGLNSASKYIQSAVRALVSMRRTPRLQFRVDDSLKRQAAVYDAIREGLETEARQGRESEAASEENRTDVPETPTVPPHEQESSR